MPLPRLSWTLFVLSFIMVLTFSACQTVPDEDPVEENPVVAPVEVGEKLSENDIAAARSALRRAEKIGANSYFPTEYRALANDLNQAVTLGENDVDAARKALQGVVTESNDLYDKTYQTRKNQYLAHYTRNKKALLEIEADRFAPRVYAQTESTSKEAIAFYAAGDIANAQTKGDENLTLQGRLHYNLNENIRYANILRRDSENYLRDAEDNEAFLYASEELEAANTYYTDGLESFDAYDLDKSVGLLFEAKKQAVLAARLSAVEKRKSETDSLMTQTQRRIEAASQLEVVDSQGVVVGARPWEGKEYLDSNPLVAEPVEIEAYNLDDVAKLRNLDTPIGIEQEEAPEDIPIQGEGTQVNGDEQDADYLLFAEEHWKRGVGARNIGQFDLADDYFRQAQSYIEAYESNAIGNTYTVVYRKVATDSLWRIAEYKTIFGNPFLWPKIWRANRRSIQNPDLIYPGQVLAIPPQ